MVDTSTFQTPGLGPPPSADFNTPPAYGSGGQPQQQQQVPPWLQDILNQYGGYELSDQDIAALGYAQLGGALQQQAAEQQYKQDFLGLQSAQLGLNAEQLGQAQKEFEFQSGPYWEFYKGPYFDYLKQKTGNELAMSNNDLGISNNNLLVSGQDVLKAKDYALAANQQRQQQELATSGSLYDYLRHTGGYGY